MRKALSLIALAMGLFFTASAQYENTFIKLGQQAPELAFPTPEGKTLKLSDINKDRYVILDFWASWCGPCRMANPGLVRMYNEYTTKKFKGAKKGFTVVSFSLDNDKGRWMDAIRKDGLVWEYHMSDLMQWQSAATRLYGLQYIPQAFLLDPKGKIIGKYSRAEEAEDELKKHLQ
ncbi:MAG: TlpA family protein disulfide reductase [Chitinophagia bacterium]|nr:TlpA family protein disulfide reductase [Chitinophagia bacterium]